MAICAVSAQTCGIGLTCGDEYGRQSIRKIGDVFRLTGVALRIANARLGASSLFSADVTGLLVGFNASKFALYAGGKLTKPSNGITQFFIWPKPHFEHEVCFRLVE